MTYPHYVDVGKVTNPLIIALAEDVMTGIGCDHEEAETLCDELCDYIAKAIHAWAYHIEQVREYAEGHPREDVQ